MHVTFWGTRGSIAKAGPTTLRFGGNTPCVEVRSDSGTLVVIDCGTGAHGLGTDLMAHGGGDPVSGHLLISHTHWDHIQGLPFFAPLFDPTGAWQIYGPRGLDESLHETLTGQMQYSYFPVTHDQFAAEVEYHELVEGTFDIDDIRVTTRYLNHPALTLGYRLEVDGAALVYASDHEPHHHQLAAGGEPTASRNDLAHARFLEGADLLIHDAQYLTDEYPQKQGWGHSTIDYAVDAARWAGAARLALFHHDPTRTDDDVDALLVTARERAAAAGWEGDVLAAAEGTTIELRGDPTRAHGAHERAANPGDSLDDVRRSVLLAIGDPEIAAILRHAAEAEELEVVEATSRDEAVEMAREHRPGIVLLDGGDDDGALTDFAAAIGDLDPTPDGEISLITIAATGASPVDAHDLAITDALTWPASTGYLRTKLRAWLLRRACRWQNAPLPDNEADRLRTLHDLGVLDTEPEDRFDRYTSLASTTFDVPIALVSLVDADRQWFKSRHGIEATETPRDRASWAHAILDDDVLQGADALSDPRFADNPLVREDPRVRFYAGVPLTLSDGSRAGTLCVIDHRPRLLDDDQLAELQRLGALVSAELERH